MSGEPAAGRRPRDSSHSRPPQGSAKRGRPASKARTSCPVCKNAWKWCSVACAGRADAGRAATGVALGQGGQAPDAEDQAFCGLVAGDGGAHPALQPAMPHVVHAGEAATLDARGQTMHGCSPGQRVPQQPAVPVPEELGTDVEQAAAEPRRSQRDSRGRAAPRLGDEADGDLGEQATQRLPVRRRASAAGEGDRGRARRCLGHVLDADLGEEAGAPRTCGVGRRSQSAGPRMSGAAAPTAAAESNRAPTASAREHTKKAPKTVAARIVKVLGADCGLDPGTKLLSVVSEWMETSPLVYRVCGEVYRPPHKWSDLAGAAKLWTGTQVRVLDGAPFRKLRCQFNVPSTANVAEAVDHIVSESIRRHALYKSNVRALHRVVGHGFW